MEHRDRPAPRHPTRREVVAFGIGAFVVAAVPLARRSRARLVRRTIPVMGTIAEVAVVHRDAAYAHAAIDAAFEELRLVDRLMTRFTPTSEIGCANAGAWRDGVAVSEPTAAVLYESLRWAEASDGAFDPCLGRAVELWDVGHRTVPPAESSVRTLAGRHLYRALDLDGTMVRFTDPDVAVDLGGIGKGYAVDRAVATLRAWGIDRGLVNAGGDLYALGTSEDGDPWKVGIRSPSNPTRLAGEIDVSDAAIATSGDYLQRFAYDGKSYHHLLDPATGGPRVTGEHSVTIKAASCMAADAGATAVFGMDEPRARALLGRVAGAELVKAV
jgi:thiamine biosynthesis lipoprotein